MMNSNKNFDMLFKSLDRNFSGKITISEFKTVVFTNLFMK